MASDDLSSKNLKQAISSKISELEALTRAAGDSAVSDYLKKISESDDQLLSLHRALVKKLKRRGKADATISERRAWFSNFISRGGKTLSEDEVKCLASMTRNWAVGDTTCLEICANIWARAPWVFCEGEKPDSDVIRRCFNDLRRMEEVDIIRRKVLLVVLSRQVFQRQEELLSESNVRKRPRKTHDSRDSPLLSFALDDICSQLWDDAEENHDARKSQLGRCSLYGWKWDRLTHTELILSLSQVAAKRFEQHGWTHIKFEALNAYTKTLPQFAIRDALRKAWDAIIRYYEEGPTLYQTANSGAQETEESQANIESAVQQAASSDEPTSASLGSDLASFDDIFPSADPWLTLPTDAGSGDRADISGNFLEPTVEDIIASADAWLFLCSVDGNTTGSMAASAGPYSHSESPAVVSGSNPTSATLGQSVVAASEA